MFVNSYMAQLGSQGVAHLSNNGSANTLVKLKCICAVFFLKKHNFPLFINSMETWKLKELSLIPPLPPYGKEKKEKTIPPDPISHCWPFSYGLL